jgi:hypothetical protein
LAETALRLATIRAAGREGHLARLNAEDMAWGADVASTVVTAMMNRSQDCLVPTVRGEFAEKLVGYIVRRGSTRREVQHYIRGRYSTREVADILTQSIEAGFIVKTARGSPSRVQPEGEWRLKPCDKCYLSQLVASLSQACRSLSQFLATNVE